MKKLLHLFLTLGLVFAMAGTVAAKPIKSSDGTTADVQFTKVSEIKMEIETIEFRSGMDSGIRKSMGRLKCGDVTLERPYSCSSFPKEWTLPSIREGSHTIGAGQVTEILQSVSEGKKGLNAVNVKREMVMPGDNVKRAMVSPGDSGEILITTPSGKIIRVVKEIKQ